MINWAVVSAGANYGRGSGDMVSRRATYLGASSTIRSFLRFVKPHATDMLDNVQKRLSQLQKTVWTLDNNQKGHPMKFQRYGSSNCFAKVTGRTVRNAILCNEDVGEENSKRVAITYVDQSIINPFSFPYLESEIKDDADTKQVLRCMLRNNMQEIPTVKLDITGKRVETYCDLVNMVDKLKFIILPFLTGYNNTKKVYKKWSLQPTEHYTDLRKQIVLRCYHETDTLREAIKFQDKVVYMWNPDSTKATSFIIPPVSLRDEIRTNGYGMAMIEILCLSGLLVHNVFADGVESWDLCKDWETKQLYLCMDGLSLDRHRSFQRKLINLPYSYARVYKQSLIFQKALSRIIDISGPLHIAFHMLQYIYIIYKDMLKWAQKVVQ